MIQVIHILGTLILHSLVTLNYLFDDLTKYKHRLIMWFRLKKI